MKELLTSLFLAATPSSPGALQQFEIRDGDHQIVLEIHAISTEEPRRDAIINEIRAAMEMADQNPYSIYDLNQPLEDRKHGSAGPKDGRANQSPTTRLLGELLNQPPFLTHSVRHFLRRDPYDDVPVGDPPKKDPLVKKQQQPSGRDARPQNLIMPTKCSAPGDSAIQLTDKTRALLRRAYRHFGQIH